MKEDAPSSRGARLPILGAAMRFLRGNAAKADAAGGLAPSGPRIYRCGTLTYTKAALVALFAWLLWGDFCYTIMIWVAPLILPLKLKALLAPNWLTGLIMTAVPNIMISTVVPAVSFKSDRYRSRWGRRIPFIMGTLPFLCVSLALLGCSDDVGACLQRHLAVLRNLAPATITIGLIAIFWTIFQFFSVFVSSLFYYLLNDVAPPEHMARFIGSFRIVGCLATALYHYFVFRYALTNMREIMVGAALLYFIGFTLVCAMVKEGEYPPVEGEDRKDFKGWRAVKTFFKESFGHKWYRLFFAWNSIWALGAAMSMFGVFFNMEMGLSLGDIGKLNGICLAAAMVAMYLASMFVDRWNPMRVLVYMGVFTAFTAFSRWVWIDITLPGKYYFWLSLSAALIGTFFAAWNSVCGYPLLIRIYPKSRFGQFYSAQEIVASACKIVSGVAAGLFIDGAAWLCANSGLATDFAYRFNFIWSGFFLALTGGMGVWVYLHWQRLGGERGYQPPASWSPKGTEELVIVPTGRPQSRWLSLSLRLFNAIMALSVLALPAMVVWMHQRGALIAARWYVLMVLPGSLAAWIAWHWLERGIRQDMARSRRGEPLRNGIPHHGMLMFASVLWLLALGVWVAQVVITVRLNLEWECIVFGIANVANNFLLTGAVLVIWRMERGWSDKMDEEAGTAPALPPATA